MLRSRFPRDLATRPLGAFLLALPVLLVLVFLTVILLAAQLAGDRLYLFSDFHRVPTELRLLLLVMACGALGGAMSAFTLSFDEDLRSPFRVATASIIAAMLGMLTAFCAFVMLSAGLVVVLVEAPSITGLSPYFLAFVSIVAGLLSPTILERLQIAGRNLFGSENRSLSSESEGRVFDGSIATSPARPQWPWPAPEANEVIFSAPFGNRPNAGQPRAQSQALDLRLALSQLEDRIASLQVRPDLDNFDGIAVVRLCDSSGVTLPLEDSPAVSAGTSAPADTAAEVIRHAAASPNSSVQALVTFDGSRSTSDGPSGSAASADGPFRASVRIKNGRESESVTFRVSVDSEKIEFTPATERTTFSARGRSRALPFSFKAPSTAGTYPIYVEVMQKRRLIQVVTASLVVKGR